MVHLSILLFLTVAVTASVNSPKRSVNDSRPTATVKNGTYYGQHNANYKQDIFLGIPYAQPPLGDLRFRVPQTLNSSWDDQRNATEYSPQCFGYGSDTWVLGNYVSEDCLTINVVRPHGVSEEDKLPVAVWIHGGGLTTGGSSDPRYNLSFIVEQSVKMRTPFIAASINYRLHAWGFLWSKEIEQAGAGNLGFRDQRLALEWVNQNIGAFGGDPDQVTIWGESAGARSVSTQLLAYGGRDDSLFRSAILQSGTGLDNDFGEIDTSSGSDNQDYYNELVKGTNCTASGDTLQCLRQVPSWTFSDLINATSNPGFGSVVDGDFLQASRAELLRAGKVVDVPIIIGTNFDEGTQSGEHGINTTAEWNDYLKSSGANATTVATLSALYPDIPSIGLPATLEGRPTGDIAEYGRQWKRVVAFSGDQGQHAPRRWWTRTWASKNMTAYTYHFNVLVNGLSPADGARHFQEVAFVFDNTLGVGYETAVAENPFEGEPNTFNQLADTMSRMWVSFITNQDPNYSAATCTHWPKYSTKNPENMRFDVNASTVASLEPDDYRAEQIEFLIGKIWGDQLLSTYE